MFRKSLITSLFIVAALFAANIGVSAQIFTARGKVEMRQADGTNVPVENAVVDVYRTDINSKGVSTKTNKKGEYSIVGLTFGGVFMFAASAPGAAPGVIPDIRGSVEKDYDFVLNAGDGKRLTMEEALQMKSAGNISASGSDAKLTPEQKKAQEEQQKKIDEVNAKNSKIENANKVIDASVKAGNAAFQAKDYTTAIAQYKTGYDADPEYFGSVPTFLNNMSGAYRQRGVERYTKYNTSKDAADKDAAKQDFEAAYETAKKSLDFMNNSPGAKDPQFANALPKNKADANNSIRETLRLLTKTKLDLTHMDELNVLYEDAITAEPAVDKKTALRVEVGNLLMNNGDLDKALAEFEKILVDNPQNVDALAGKGLCLISLAGDDKAKLQEGLNVLQAFVDVAPDNHPYKEVSITTIEGFKNDQKMVPQKSGKAAPKKKP